MKVLRCVEFYVVFIVFGHSKTIAVLVGSVRFATETINMKYALECESFAVHLLNFMLSLLFMATARQDSSVGG